MKLQVIDTGYFKLDGGAMFGVVPKVIWQNINPPDEKNLCTWALRCLLVEIEDRRILIDCGLGNKQSEKFFSYYEPHGDATLASSLSKAGYGFEDITDVFLTHLHFDHCGGAIKKDQVGNLIPAFPNAVFWSNRTHWEWAVNPNAREKASFLKENLLPMQESGRLKFVEEKDRTELFPGFNVRFVNGHTKSMMIPHIKYNGKTIVYMADLLPSAGHIPLPYVMAYDVQPLETLKEKKQFLEEAEEKEYILFFEHDKKNECCTLERTERGIRPKETFNLKEVL